MKLPSIWVYTHDSIGLGEDGPTHQPIEQLPGLRAIPRLYVVRPADANETALAWKLAIERTDGPTALALSRQGLPVLDADAVARDGIERGAYVLREAAGEEEPDLILIGTGAEVHLCLEAAEALEAEGLATRVVSMPCMDAFAEQDAAYRDAVLPPGCRARLAVEAANPLGWHRWVGDDGAVLGMETFGESGPYKAVFEEFGFTAENVAERARAVYQRVGTAVPGS
jgi:transketolase